MTHSLKTLSTFKTRFADQYYHRPSGVQARGNPHALIRFHRQPRQPEASLQTPPPLLSFPPPQFCPHNVPWVADRPSHSLRCTGTPFNSSVCGHNGQDGADDTGDNTSPAAPPAPPRRLRRAGSRPHATAGTQPRQRSVPLSTLRGSPRRPPPRPAGGLDRMPAVGRCRLRRPGPPPGPGAESEVVGFSWRFSRSPHATTVSLGRRRQVSWGHCTSMLS